MSVYREGWVGFSSDSGGESNHTVMERYVATHDVLGLLTGVEVNENVNPTMKVKYVVLAVPVVLAIFGFFLACGSLLYFIQRHQHASHRAREIRMEHFDRDVNSEEAIAI